MKFLIWILCILIGTGIGVGIAWIIENKVENENAKWIISTVFIIVLIVALAIVSVVM